MGEKGARLTAVSEAFHENVLARLDPLGGIASRRMFGGFGLFHDGAMFGIISKSTLFFKVDDTSFPKYRAARSRQHRPMPYYSVPATVLSRKSQLHAWAKTAIGVAHAGKLVKKK